MQGSNMCDLTRAQVRNIGKGSRYIWTDHPKAVQVKPENCVELIKVKNNDFAK